MRGFGIEPRGGALLDQLLVPPLHRAVALPEVDHVAVVVGDHLDLDVAGMLDVFFQIDVGVAEGGLGLGLGLLDGRLQGQIVQGHAHAASAAAGRRLDQHRKAQLVGQARRPGASLSTSPSLPGTVGTSTSLANLPGGVLVAHQGHRLVRGADELDLATAANLGEMRVFGQKSVARMNRLHVADLGGADDAVDLQIAVGGLRRTDAIGLVGQVEVGGAAVGLAEDGHRFDAQLAAGTKDAQGDFTAIGNQNSLEHGYSRVSTLNSGCPNSTGEPFSANTAMIAARDLRRNLIEHLHGLDDADGRFRPDVVADLHKRRRLGIGRRIERAHHRALDHQRCRSPWLPTAATSDSAAAPAPAGSGGAARRRRRRPPSTGCAAVARPAKLNPHFALLEVDLAEIVLLHQFHEAANLADIENVLVGRRGCVHGFFEIVTSRLGSGDDPSHGPDSSRTCSSAIA